MVKQSPKRKVGQNVKTSFGNRMMTPGANVKTSFGNRMMTPSGAAARKKTVLKSK